MKKSQNFGVPIGGIRCKWAVEGSRRLANREIAAPPKTEKPDPDVSFLPPGEAQQPEPKQHGGGHGHYPSSTLMRFRSFIGRLSSCSPAVLVLSFPSCSNKLNTVHLSRTGRMLPKLPGCATASARRAARIYPSLRLPSVTRLKPQAAKPM